MMVLGLLEGLLKVFLKGFYNPMVIGDTVVMVWDWGLFLFVEAFLEGVPEALV